MRDVVPLRETARLEAVSWVAVGCRSARHPPHRSVRALLTHTVLTLDVWTQSVPPDTDAGSRLPESGARVSPESAPTSSGSVDSAGEAATTTCVALRAETPSVGPRCARPHGTGNIRAVDSERDESQSRGFFTRPVTKSSFPPTTYHATSAHPGFALSRGNNQRDLQCEKA